MSRDKHTKLLTTVFILIAWYFKATYQWDGFFDLKKKLIGSVQALTQLLQPFRFLIRIRGDIPNRKIVSPLSAMRGATTPRINDTECYQTCVYLWYGEFFSRILSAMLHCWYGQSPTQRIVDTECHRLRILLTECCIVDMDSHQLSASLIRSVTDFAYCWQG